MCKKGGYSKIVSLVPVITNEVFGFSKNACLMVNYSKHKGGALANATYITGTSIISWNHGDAIVRIKYNRASPSVPLLSTSSVLDRVSTCCTAVDLNLLLIGYDSGSMAIYTFNRPLKVGSPIDDKNYAVKRLVGHSGAISALYISKEFSVAVSGGNDGQCLLWDLNKYCYVRSITEHENKVKLLVISPTLGDIVSVSDFENGSTLKVNTINGTNVGHIRTEIKIEAVCYSSAPEGVSVNVIATGFENGAIKLWSSWDLTAVRVITVDRFTAPIKW
ncbi:Lysosomal-trafficking regulator-like protein, partial [Leptotrombidium deliense]